jgi:hypothetical protein
MARVDEQCIRILQTEEIPSHGVEVQSSIATSRQIFTFPNIDKVFSRVRNS